MASRPDNDLTSLQERADLIHLANGILGDSKNVWKDKTLLRRENSWTLGRNLGIMEEDLTTLKELDLSQFTSLDERIKKRLDKERKDYFESAIVISKNLLKRVDNIERRAPTASFEPEHGPNQTVFLSKYIQPIKAMNDGAISLKMAEQYMDGNYTVPELNELAENTALEMYRKRRDDVRIENKSPSEMGTMVWSVLNIIDPIVEIDDENELYYRIALGHPGAWGELNKRVQDTRTYIDYVRRGDRYIRMKHDEWFIYLCFPELLSIEAGPWLKSLLFEYNGKSQLANRQQTESSQRYVV